ncbi:MAG: hypothetical protein PF505_02535 [Vallitaleaceae bacterium]|nr:hypothetical protein [Vallitaleaceae bacterium]
MDDSYVDKEYEKHGEKVLEIWKLRNEFGLADLNYIHAYRMGQIINISNPDEYSNLSNQLYGQSAQQVYLEVYKSRNIKELRNSFLC